MKSFEAVNVKKRFEGVIALKNLDFKFEGPKICGLVGANGSGKTTFAKICCGLVRRDEGQFFIDGRQVDINSPFDAKKFGIVLAHQNLSLIPEMSVWENIDLGHEERQGGIFFNNKKAKDTAFQFLDDLFHGEISIETKIGDLSPSQKQMVEIAKALSQNPKMLILDEPTAALEYFHVERLFKKILELKDNGISIIFISHRLWEIIKICDTVYAFRNGEDVGTVDFRKQPRDEKLVVPLVTGTAGYEMNNSKSCKKEFKNRESILQLKEISFKNKLKDINFKVREGEILGIGGLQGQGQEYLTMLIAGAISPSAGKIIFDKKEIRLKQPIDAINKGIYLVPGDRTTDGLFMDQRIFNNVVYPRFSLRKDKFFLSFSKLFKITDNIISKTSLVPAKRDIIVSNLSGGNQQKVVFGRWLQFLPKILVLNDPAKGVDIQARNDLYKIVRELAAQGTTVILYSTSNEELISNCDRVLIMFEGQIVEEIQHENICHEKIVSSSLRAGGEGEAN
ncbi:MAG: sugar ABC transporter ATP-binding protein [Candidatus Humimicrobiaceae bacterium]